MLVDIADLYISIPVVATAVAQAILEDYISTETLKHDITTDPVAYILCAGKLRWRELFNDAFIHLVGQWRRLRHSTRVKELPPALLEALQEESFHLYESIQETDRKLQNLWHSMWSGRENVPDRQILDWTNKAASDDATSADFGLASLYQEISDSKFVHRSYPYAQKLGYESCEAILDPMLKNNLVFGKQEMFPHLVCAYCSYFPWENNKKGECN